METQLNWKRSRYQRSGTRAGAGANRVSADVDLPASYGYNPELAHPADNIFLCHPSAFYSNDKDIRQNLRPYKFCQKTARSAYGKNRAAEENSEFSKEAAGGKHRPFLTRFPARGGAHDRAC